MSFNFKNCFLLSSFALKWDFSSANIIPSIIEKTLARTQNTCTGDLIHMVRNKFKDFLGKKKLIKCTYFARKWDFTIKEKNVFVLLMKWLYGVWPNSWEERCALEETTAGGNFALTVGTWLSGSDGKSFYFNRDFNPLMVVATLRTFFSCQHTKALPPASNYWTDINSTSFLFFFFIFSLFTDRAVASVLCACCENISSRAANADSFNEVPFEIIK